jgi:hypothetical protein
MIKKGVNWKQEGGNEEERMLNNAFCKNSGTKVSVRLALCNKITGAAELSGCGVKLYNEDIVSLLIA